MRYMGTMGQTPPLPIPNIPNLFPGGGGAAAPFVIDPNAKAQLMAQASTLPDGYASELCDVCEATPYAKRWTMIRYGIGAALGLGLGYVVFSRMKRR